MHARSTDLSDLLTASGLAMGHSNQRLAAAGAPALLREFSLTLSFFARVSVAPDACTLSFGRVSRQNPQLKAAGMGATPNISVQATYIAAPSVLPAPPPPPPGGDCPP